MMPRNLGANLSGFFTRIVRLVGKGLSYEKFTFIFVES